MAKINQKLLQAIKTKTRLGQAAIYARINAISRKEMLPLNLAAIRLGADEGLVITKYATSQELQELRNAGSPVTPPPGGPLQVATPKVTTKKPAKGKKKGMEAGTAVFVVHGRDMVARNDMFTFLRALGLHPIEWLEAIKMTKKAQPYVGQILDAAFANAQAVVVLMTPDDLTQLRPDLVKPNDKSFEKKLTGQARPNVLFEAGLAFGRHPDRTILVELGNLREFSDVGGRHTVRMSNSPEARQSLASRLEFAGCKVNRDGQDWLSAGKFADPTAGIAKGKKKKKKRQG